MPGFVGGGGGLVPAVVQADGGVVEKTLRHLEVWHAPPPGDPSPQAAPGSWTYEPCDDVNPMPDYENVITD